MKIPYLTFPYQFINVRLSPRCVNACVGDDAPVKAPFTRTVNVSLVSTYVVCERLSVMHELAGVVENLVQNSESAPLSEQTHLLPPPLKIEKI